MTPFTYQPNDPCSIPDGYDVVFPIVVTIACVALLPIYIGYNRYVNTSKVSSVTENSEGIERLTFALLPREEIKKNQKYSRTLMASGFLALLGALVYIIYSYGSRDRFCVLNNTQNAYQIDEITRGADCTFNPGAGNVWKSGHTMQCSLLSGMTYMDVHLKSNEDSGWVQFDATLNNYRAQKNTEHAHLTEIRTMDHVGYLKFWSDSDSSRRLRGSLLAEVDEANKNIPFNQS